MASTIEILQVLDDIQACEVMDDILDKSKLICNSLDVEYYIATGLPSTSKELVSSVLANSYPDDWTESYLTNDYLLDDPVVKFCPLTLFPFEWAKLDYSDNRGTQIMAEAANVGLASGFTIPVHTEDGLLGCVSLASPRLNLSQENRFMMHLFGLYLHGKLRFLNDELIPDRPLLTVRESDVLRWGAVGKTNADIAEILTISERTVHFHWARMAEKLGTLNKTHTVAAALGRRILQL